MAGIITISVGHDASYPWRQIGTADGADRNRERGVGYYLSPSAKGGEPPGRWTGLDVTELGFTPGAVVEREVFERLYGQFIDPRDPAGQARLGRAPQRFRPAEEIYAELAAAEPEATAERRAQLQVEAKMQAREPVFYFDATFSVSKSITLLHASALANAVAAAEAGDTEAAGYWEQAAADVWRCIEAGNAAGLEYLQREAGYTRAGYHGRQPDGVPTGRWEDAHRWVIASFPQHTSRDGDPQLHIHNLVLNRVRRENDGKWRTLDSQALFQQRAAASAVATLVMENALTAEFGVQWVQRKDGHGREVAGVRQALMDLFSHRRQTIDPLTAALAEQFKAQYGRAPDARALGKLRQWANHQSRRGKDAEPLDLRALVQKWVAQQQAAEAGALTDVMPAVTTRRGPTPEAAPHAEPGPDGATAEPAPLAGPQAQRLLAEALAACQEASSTWTRSALVRQLGERLPAALGAMSAAEARSLLPDLAAQVLAGATGKVICLEAPERLRIPDALRRPDGRSIYTLHDAAQYATQAQLTLEQRLIAQAQAGGAPRMERAAAAQALGADAARLQAQLQEASTSAASIAERTGAGLRLDQAAAAYYLLTSDRRAEVLAGPAGSGKTRTLAGIARAWRQAWMGEVIGLTTSQAARNVLADAGVDRAYNTARFLGHRGGQRGALGSQQIRPGTLLVLDEASTISMPDLAAIVAIAEDKGGKVILAGDHEQLTAVQSGGGMMMLARQLGYVQLAEPVRFRHEWERTASLRLRAGDTSVLADYDEHGRIRGGSPEQMMEQAYRGWLADHLEGKDALLLARTEDQARELSRRARDDLIRYGHVSAGATVPLLEGAKASRGDLIQARKNAPAIRAGGRSRPLANRDVLQIVSMAAGPRNECVLVRLLAGRDPQTRECRWSQPFAVPRRYLARWCNLAYATTYHDGQGRTVDTAHAVVDGLGDRQGLYVAMSRAELANYVYCVTTHARAADLREGTRPAPEMDRASQLSRERAGVAGEGDTVHERRDPLAVLAEVLGREGSQMSATETLQAELSRADHLAVLGSIWLDLARRTQEQRFEQALRDALPADLAAQALGDPACTWLWRSLREAEAAGLEGAEALHQAMASRPLTGARDVARVLDARVRWSLEGRPPAAAARWADQVPDMGDPDLQRFMTDLADAMDERVERLGQHAAQVRPVWAIQALGEVPHDPLERASWEDRAGAVAAYRELYGYSHPSDPVGPEPGKTSPEARAAWHNAMQAIGDPAGDHLQGRTDGQLWAMRSAYERETAWAPPHVAEELRLMRLAERDARVKAFRAEHEAQTATDEGAAVRQNLLARSWRVMEGKARTEAEIFAAIQDRRREWEAVTEPTRRQAVAADLALRRRNPGQAIEPLRTHQAEAQGAGLQGQAGAARREVWVQPTLDGTPHLPADRTAQAGEPAPGSAGEHGRLPGWPDPGAVQLALGLTPETVHHDIPGYVHRLAEQARIAGEKLDELRNTPQPHPEDDEIMPSHPWAVLADRDRDAVLQPPKPEVLPSREILRRQAERAEPQHAEAEQS